ncbi:hypothetical protein SAMN05216389_10177 [Oceanobacillus limi]|uniref:Uncharacterized protein n=1 Tax=Oceanobacillus limi TaxID=930131 RepID=A0A1H9Y1A5_9BACI|nr:hypothetical protein [Oceanobacillus limi]SES62026.1 hypothetical protein SAMN05216389_10177 [Oceanobacillus limi]
MRIISFSTRLTPTSIGQSGTNDSYIYFPKAEYITDLFFDIHSNHTMTFTSKKDGSSHQFNMKFTNENRLYQFGPYARSEALEPGDEVILQKVEYDDGQSQYYFDYIKYDNIVVLYYLGNQKYFTTWNQERFNRFVPSLPFEINVLTTSGQSTVTIEDNGLIRKRADSPNAFQSYRIDGLFNLVEQDEFKSKNKLILTKLDNGNEYTISRPINWEFSVIEKEGVN